MKKTLSTIQTIYKVIGIVCKVLFVCTIVAAILCLLGFVFFCAFGVEGIPSDIFDIKGVIGGFTSLTKEEIIYTFICAIIECSCAAVLLYFTTAYFKNELVNGTPFTKRGAKELFRLGILQIAFFFGVTIFLGITKGIISFKGTITIKQSNDGVGSIWTGLLYMFLSLVYKYVAEKEECEKNEELE